MFWFGSLMSQVLQWTQFCALIDEAFGVGSCLPSFDPFVDAGRAIAARRAGEDIVLGALLQRHVARPAGAPAGPPRGWCWTGTPTTGGRRSARRRASDRRSSCAWRPARARRSRPCRASACRTGEKPNSVFSHMSKPPSPTPSNGAEARPQRLDVADLLQVLADVGGAPGVLVGGQLVIGAAGGDRRRDMLGRQHARQHRIVRALDARHVDEAGRAADQRAAREATASAPTASRPR